MLKWWRQRQEILKEEPKPIYQEWVSECGTSGLVLSSLTLESVCSRFRESFPPPPNFQWVLRQLGKAQVKGYYQYHFKLKEIKNESKTGKGTSEM